MFTVYLFKLYYCGLLAINLCFKAESCIFGPFVLPKVLEEHCKQTNWCMSCHCCCLTWIIIQKLHITITFKWPHQFNCVSLFWWKLFLKSWNTCSLSLFLFFLFFSIHFLFSSECKNERYLWHPLSLQGKMYLQSVPQGQCSHSKKPHRSLTNW